MVLNMNGDKMSKFSQVSIKSAEPGKTDHNAMMSAWYNAGVSKQVFPYVHMES